MFDIEKLMSLGVFNQLIPIWQVFFFVLSLLPFLLLNRVKICLLITYLFTYYLGFMVQWGNYISAAGSMEPFVLYSFSGLLVAIIFVATIFTDEPKAKKVRWVRYSEVNEGKASASRVTDPLEEAINISEGHDRD